MRGKRGREKERKECSLRPRVSRSLGPSVPEGKRAGHSLLMCGTEERREERERERERELQSTITGSCCSLSLSFFFSHLFSFSRFGLFPSPACVSVASCSPSLPFLGTRVLFQEISSTRAADKATIT